MCRTPGCECKPMEEDIPIGDNNVVSEDESEPMDSESFYTESSSDDGDPESDVESASGNRVTIDMNNVVSEDESEPMDSESFYTESSSDDGDSESDVESASGNRVTIDMVVLLMLKENNVVSEEWYRKVMVMVMAQKVEHTADDIKSLIPKLPKTEASSDDDSVGIKDRSSFEDLFEQLLAEKENRQSTGNKNAESQESKNEESSQESSDDNKLKNDADVKGNAVNQDQSKGDATAILQQDTTAGFNEKSEEVTTTIEQQETNTEIKEDKTSQEEMLPEHKVLCSWYVRDDDKPGLAKRAFDILRQRSSKKRLTCSLMSIDILLTNYRWNGDQVDYGGGCNFEYTDKAAMVYVFILVSLDEGWKMPIGYIFAKCVEAESQAELIRVCLTQCDDAGVDVVAVTVDTLTPATFLGCSVEDPRNLKTTFKHPVNDRDVAVWIDPCLALRSARHTLKAKEVLKDGAGAKIRWNLIRKLRRLNFDDIDLDKLEFAKLRNHMVKAGLTTEIFSDSLIPALELCEKLIPNMFKDTAATRKYIEIVNTLYDILNSNTTKDIGDVIHQLDVGKEYMLGLFCNEENKLSPFDKVNLCPDKKLLYWSLVEGRPACGFIGFLICIESFKHLFATLVEKEQRLDFLNPHQLCKDHAEDFVNDLQAQSSLEPPVDCTGFFFQCYYDRVFDVLEENSRLSINKFSLGHWRLKNKYPPAVTIKLTSGKRAFDESYSFQYRPKKIPKTSDEDKATNLVREYSKAMDTEMDLSTRKNMVGYLAGWIAARFARCLKCETCIDALCSDRKLWFHKFITFKHLKGVCLPSEEVFRICWECERALRLKTSPAKLRGWVLRRLAHRFPWRNGPPATRHHAIHHILLARAVISKYVPLRVSAPFSSRESQRILDMYNLFSRMRDTGFFEHLERMSRNDESGAGNDL